MHAALPRHSAPPQAQELECNVSIQEKPGPGDAPPCLQGGTHIRDLDLSRNWPNDVVAARP